MAVGIGRFELRLFRIRQDILHAVMMFPTACGAGGCRGCCGGGSSGGVCESRCHACGCQREGDQGNARGG